LQLVIGPGIAASLKGEQPDVTTKDYWHQYSQGLCPLGQVAHGNGTVCCLPMACPPGKFLVTAFNLIKNII